MIKLALSEIKKLPFDFDEEVAKFVAEKKAHLTTEGVPAPTHQHSMVEYAVRRVPGKIEKVGGTTVYHPDDFVADYEIVDDTPPPPTLDEKKKMLADQLNMKAFALANQVIPPLKKKLFDFHAADANAAVRAGTATADHNDFLAEDGLRQKKVDAIYRHVAELESQIHDLTEDQIDVWQGAPFPEV